MNHWRVLSVPLMALITSTAWAQTSVDTTDDEPGQVVELSSITVKGEKVERSLQETVSSVQVFDQDAIDRQNYVDLYEVLDQTANVYTGFNDSVFSIRGIRNQGAGLGDSTSDVSTIYVDGVFIPSSLFRNGALNLWDVSSVEIFRGPQSTIQGRNALAGAIVIETVDPAPYFEGRAQASYAEYNSWRTSAAVSVPLGTQAGLRLAIDETQTDGFIDNPTLGTDTSDAQETTTFRSKLVIAPDAIPGLTLTGNYTYIDAQEGEGRIDDDFFPGQRINFENLQSENDTRADILSFEADYQFNDNWSFTSVTGYVDNTADFFLDTTRDETGGTASNIAQSNDEIFSQELRLNFRTERMNALFGAYYFDRTGDQANDSETFIESEFAFPDPTTLASLIFMTPMPDPAQVAQAAFIRSQIIMQVPQFPIQFDRSTDIDIQNWALFGQVDYELTDRLSMSLGLRYDSEEISQNVFDSTFVPPFPPLGDPLLDQIIAAAAAQFSNTVDLDNVENDFSAFLPKAVLTYEWNDHISTSLSYQRGYRAGGLSVNLFRAALAPPGADQNALEIAGIVNRFDPEFTNNYEFAFRSNWLDNRLLFNANVFYIDYTDQQVNVAISSNPLDRLTDNVGESELYGFEVELLAVPVAGLELGLNVGYTDTEFTDGGQLLDEVIGGGADLTGNEFSFAPNLTASAQVRYEWLSGWFANARVRYSDEAFSQPSNDPSAINDSFTVLDLIAGYQADRWRGELFLTNVTDEEYLTFNPVDPAVGAIAVAGDPRVLGGRVVVEF
ncbi:MAG: TonB-dependent receptor [Pseudomonadota bacterium]